MDSTCEHTLGFVTDWGAWPEQCLFIAIMMKKKYIAEKESLKMNDYGLSHWKKYYTLAIP